jgi:hypothetical protein
MNVVRWRSSSWASIPMAAMTLLTQAGAGPDAANILRAAGAR